MSARVRITAKTFESKRENSVSRKRKTDFSQYISSPIDHILHLQRTIGNQAVQRLFKSGVILAKLRISQPNDIYEQEANRVADQVMRMQEPNVQKQSEEEEELIQTKLISEQITPLVQRQVEPEEEEEAILQAKGHTDRTPEVSPELESRIKTLRGGGHPLAASTRSFFEPRFGYDFSQVRVHSDAKSADTVQAVNAKAFTVESDIMFGAGQYAPETSTGKRLVAHELTHVLQQKLKRFPVLQYKKTKTKKKTKIASKDKKKKMIIIKKDVRKASINEKKGIDEITSDFYKPLIPPLLTIGKFGCSLRRNGLTVDQFFLDYKLKDSDFRVQIRPWSGEFPFSTVICWIRGVEFRAKLRQIIYIPNDFATHPCTKHLDPKKRREKILNHERLHETDNVSVYEKVVRKIQSELLFTAGVGRYMPLVKITDDPDSFVDECKEEIRKKMDYIVKEHEIMYYRLSAQAASKRDPHDKEIHMSKLKLLEDMLK